jgi:hypothetical protein
VKLRPGEYFEIDTARCAETFSAIWTVLDTACTPEGSDWAFVEHIPRFGGREHGGWINTRHVRQVACEAD